MGNQKLVVIGNGMAGVRSVEEILNIQSSQFDIVVFGSEPHANYNRILLSSVLQGNTSIEATEINSREWYAEKRITLYSNEAVIKIERDQKLIRTNQNRVVGYDKLIIATGSTPFVIPVPGSEKEGILSFRTIEDCEKLIEASKSYKKAVVIGGGLLGLEAARGLLHLGMNVDVVHLGDCLMERQLDRTASTLLQHELEKQGMHFLLNKATEEIIGGKRVEAVRFKDGSEVEADLVIMAVGVRPNIQLAIDSGLETNRAIIVNDHLQTSDPDIYAVGECVEHRGMVYGLVKPLYEQGRELAKHICEKPSRGYQGSVLSTQLKISGIDVFSVGEFHDDDNVKSVKIFDEVEGIYKKVVFRDGIAIGAVLFGDTRDGSKLIDFIKKGAEAEVVKATVLNQSISSNENRIALMEQSEVICQCNNVSKGAILEAVQTGRLTTVDQIKQSTRASGSCGGCKSLVCELLTYTQSDDFDEFIEAKSLCDCTTLTENEVVEEIQQRQLKTIDDVRIQLDWSSFEGCSTCTAAVQYYLGMIYSGDRDEQVMKGKYLGVSLQDDGMYTVTPQMYGGMATVADLRRITYLMETHDISSVVLSSTQRMQLMGIKKANLKAVMRELGMKKKTPFKYTVQSARTYLSESISVRDKKESLQLSVVLDKKLECIHTPQHIAISVSASQHNFEAKLHDIALIKINRGWELYLGGQFSRVPEEGSLLCIADTNEEAISITTALVQYYRETANYLETTKDWMNRVSMVHVREVLFDLDLREDLLGRFQVDVSKKDLKEWSLN
ncbi:nitrite reductase large subunit NirB [Halalkalibacter nanhaiisediminis]|uniref:Nitrite reductase (NADH) large subunit n=1 Tax=Halalkalibacter nanhaiisediminis TaxID=688079 RepID=A0A562QDE7_9BACI|nr:nitrite reductase large subunit NirB [Halalkalibacter nanhaiisediminis]TWI54056.1 nitrite reductase (NADH) large subunit [Halalkalibacter nanhaiisediminis]